MLIDTYEAGTKKDHFKDPRIRVHTIFDYKSTYGVVLAGNSTRLLQCSKSYMQSHKDEMFEHIGKFVHTIMVVYDYMCLCLTFIISDIKDVLNERRNEQAKERTKERSNERTNERTNERADERTNGRQNERTNEKTNERAHERTANDRANERTSARAHKKNVYAT